MLLDHAARQELRIGEHVGHAVDLAHGHIGPFERAQRLVDVASAAPLLDGAVDLLDAAGAAVVARQVGIGGQVLAADGRIRRRKMASPLPAMTTFWPSRVV